MGSFPRGASPFGLEDMAGNVFEWCLDYFENYKGKERVNPRGADQWREADLLAAEAGNRGPRICGPPRATTTCRKYSSNDVGFRVVCECEP